VAEMAKRSLLEELDQAVTGILVHPDAPLPADARLAPLVRIAAQLASLPRPEFRARLKSDLERKTPMTTLREAIIPEESKKPAVNPIPKGYRTVTPYIVAQDADGLIEFLKNTFGAEEKFRAVGGAGGRHAELRIEDSALMVGGGAAGLSWKGDSIPSAFHIYVRDCDAVYRRALQHGATSIHEPVDQPYGERSASVKDAAGNHWYIATYNGPNYKWEGAPTLQPYMHPLRAEPVMAFLKRAFAAQELGRHASPDGVIHHLMLKIGDSFMEMGEAQGPYQPMPAMYYLYVSDCDAVYERAIEAGATSISAPADQPYGDRNAGVKDAFGNQWYIATHVKDVAPSQNG
jgi:PhnB protein